MCGLSGFLDLSQQRAAYNFEVVAKQMASQLQHRGPDDQGVWCDQEAGIALSHQRLSIVDLSPAGHQPMYSAGGRYVIVFNGEIYNHLLIRQQLGNYAWRGHSDTETVLAAIEAWGLERSLKKLVGMFAFAIWDRSDRSLTLARDRLGEKPLYYGIQDQLVMFASELKALRKHPAFLADIDREALSLYFQYNYIPAPYSIYKNVYKLQPGTWVQFKGTTIAKSGTYWSVYERAETEKQHSLVGSENEACEKLESLLKQSIAGQMLADVPVGAFLSGGVDSSTVVALMQAQSMRPVKTFTIGFNEKEYNEAEYARAIARHLGTDHTDFYVSQSDLMRVIPQLAQIYDEPFSDSSQIPTWLVAKLARQQVTVSLSGDGADELFGGYNRYLMGLNVWKKLAYIPMPLRRALAWIMTHVSADRWSLVFNAIPETLTKNLRYTHIGDKLHKLATVLPLSSSKDFYCHLVTHRSETANLLLDNINTQYQLRWPNSSDFCEKMMLLDTVMYLPDDVLCKVDRAAMNVGLESRAPYLDHRVVEFAWSLPIAMKLKNGQGKHVLRQLLYKYVPKELIERPKMGFAVPLDSLLRGPLREWAEDLLDETKLQQQAFLNPHEVRQKWHEHLSGKRNWQYQLWDILMFQLWLEKK